MNGDRAAKIFLIVFYAIFVSIALYSCFLDSSSLCLTGIRTSDDYAYVLALFENFSRSGKNLLNMQQYGYGWIYWAPLYLLTYPFYILNCEQIFTLIPRLHSLVFSLLYCLYVYKISSLYTKNIWIRSLITICNPLFPIYGLHSIIFSSCPQAAFFAAASLYYLLKYETLTTKNIRKCFILFAISLATKLSSIIMAPLIVLVIFHRYKWRFSKEKIILLLRESVIALAAFIVLLSPGVLFSKQIRIITIRSVMYYIDMYQDVNVDIISNIKEILYTNPVLIISIFGFIYIIYKRYRAYNSSEDRWLSDSTIILSGALIGIFYLIFTVPLTPVYVYRHSLAVLHLLFLGLIALDYLVKGKKILITLIFFFSLNSIFLSLYNTKSYAGLLDIINSRDEQAIQSVYKIRNVIIPLIKNKQIADRKIYFAIDSKGPVLVVTPFDKIDFYLNCIWDNLGDFSESLKKDVDIIILSKNAHGFKYRTEEEYLKSLEKLSLEKRQKRIEDFNLRKELVNSHTIYGNRFDLMYEDTYSYVFIKDTFLMDNAREHARPEEPGE
ncbi:MAG: hypothetical protein J1E80_08600 [Desulfovibrionaceae bacterium]|nr:hypothetical protein [Desulfovibrionaceae bacterium]